MCHTKAHLAKLRFSTPTACSSHGPHGQRLDHSLIQVLAECPVVPRKRGDKQSCEEPSNSFLHLPSYLVRNFLETVSHPDFSQACCFLPTFLLPPSIQLLSSVWLFAACQACLSITNSRSLLKLISIKSVMPSNIASSVISFSSCLQPCPASGSFSMSQFFASGGQSIGGSFSFSISPSNEYSGLISFRIDWFYLLAVQGTLMSLLQLAELLSIQSINLYLLSVNWY